MSRSIRASNKGKEKANEAFKLSGKTKEYIAGESKCTRPTLDKFLTGKNIDKQKFIDICEALELEWTDIAEIESSDQIQLQEKVIDELVEEIRTSIKNSVEKECGTMRVLDMSRPIELNDIYTQVNILEKIIGRRGFNLDELFQNCNLEKDEFDRFGLNKITQKRVPGLKAVNDYDKLMILGKPGVGKTTFLKYLAIQCNRGEFVETKIPIFIPLKKYAETENSPDLSSYMITWFEEDCKITNSSEKLETILTAGRGLILLDGLDEVREEDSERVIRNIENFYKRYDKNQFAVTCRIAAKEYTFTQFTEVEVADFDDEQIKTFVNSWFKIKQLPDYPKHFLEQLENNSTIKELANNPLLLTLLCLEFEDSGNFPSDRADLYARATNTLLRKWDDKRYIYRQQVYKELTPKRKEGLLSQIAFKTFDKKEYFFKQRTIESYIGEYICNLPTAPKEQTKLDIDSQAVLNSIEAQHGLLVERARGIYSFSHLTFQEYFTARKIANISNPNKLEKALTDLGSHVTETRWREVFLLTATLLEPADHLLLLMKQNIDELLANKTRLQEYLVWVRDKSNSIKSDQKIVFIRQFYHSVLLSSFLELSRSLSLYHSLDEAIKNCPDEKLKEILKQSQQQLPDRNLDMERQNKWWKKNGETWRKELREAIIKYLNSDHDWNFNHQQIDLLNQYLTANQLLMKCLNSECYVSREVREEIEDTLFLPFADFNYD